MSKFLKLSADWCAPCKQMDIQIEKLAPLVEIDNINIDTRHDIAVKYDIRSIPTLIKLDDNGDVLKRSSGSLTDAKLLEFFL